MAQKNAVFVLVPGSFSLASGYDGVTAILESNGFIAVPTELQSAGVRGTKPAAKFEDDVRHIRSTIIGLLEQDKDVILVMNSYAGFPGAEATKGLSRADRGDGKGGAVIHLVYLASFLPVAGQSVNDVMSGPQPETEDDPAQDEWMDVPPQLTAAVIFNDIESPEEQNKAFARMVNHSRASFEGRLTYPAYEHIPSTFVVAENDMVVPTTLQYAMIEAANKKGANVKIVPIDCGHSVMYSQPQKTAEVLLDLVR